MGGGAFDVGPDAGVRERCGIDWAENHHDIALVDQDGTQLAKLRISDESAGFNALLELLARLGGI
ncbi:transposase [Kitasatospora sp. NPDC057738]|uniref:IS110 family transposase n=1 Tax=Kitasatospora sp. NPDC057738 TaxID=3346233 RepID=UPI003683E7A3